LAKAVLLAVCASAVFPHTLGEKLQHQKDSFILREKIKDSNLKKSM